MSDAKGHFLVVGAGIIGLSHAWGLQKLGYQITLIDRKPPGNGASKGNAGHFATEQVFPLADPSLLPQVPSMLMDPLGPFRIKMGYLPKIVPWLARFVCNMLPARRVHNQKVISELNRTALKDWQLLLDEIGRPDLMTINGSLSVFEQTPISTQYRLANRFSRAGVACERLSAEQVAELEPALSSNVTGALWFPQTGHTFDPHQVCKALFDALMEKGARFVESEVETVSGRAEVNLTNGTWLKGDNLLLATGAWSKPFAAQLGHKVPLDTERGYHLMLPHDSGLSRPVASMERKFIITPMAGGTRLAGTVEFAGLSAPMQPRRADVLLPHGKALLPNLDSRLEDGERWMGFRPSLPDSLPVVGRSDSYPQCYFAFGHQHLGLTQAASSAQLLQKIVTGSVAGFLEQSVSANRF
ncbi:NAD(P)/FAD-dependent oxidoreductase [Ferrimonas aestuarii]|uniref:FAD-binding oxidoreductase n=1 Tax=Ferrimonas aestuarii TaxID=2569539 RepID=A0A4U1BVV8_9GAMM|nr:FAD-dependent oxidoreductase [Ferrimonas aestuarii]TKB57339.1 FAD-binding oxidoreductase [Ferrimonas aestuarii]